MRDYLRLLSYARPHRAAGWLILLLTLAGAGLGALQPWPMKLLIDSVLGGLPVPEVIQGAFVALSLNPRGSSLLIAVVAGGLMLFVLNSAVEAALAWIWTSAGRRMVYHLAEDLFARLQRRTFLFHKRNPVADLMRRVTVDSWCVYQVVDTLLFAPGHALLTTVVMILLMSQLDLTLTWLALALAPLMVGASFLLGKPLRAAAKLKREIESRIQAHIQQTLTGIPVVQAFAQEERENQRFQSFADAAIRSQQRGALLGSINSLSSGLTSTLGSGVILWIGARHVLEGSLTVGGILVFLVYLTLLQGQIKTFAGIYTTLQGLSASARRVVEILDAVPEMPEKVNAAALPPVRGNIEFRNVTTGYERGSPVLKNISLQVQPGQIIGVVGATGAGKTTLINLLPRFVEPWEGTVLIDGCDIREVGLKSLRDQIGLVLQESYLFPLPVRDNIAYGRPEASQAEIEAAARAANAHEFIAALPEGYDTIIGERGATLSGGQRQRLAIARALLRNPPILILDEPTSALDAETERLILNALETLMRDRTTLVIAHRLSTIRRADLIVVLQEGRVVERGKHDELLARGGQYARLHQLQHQPTPPLAAAVT